MGYDYKPPFYVDEFTIHQSDINLGLSEYSREAGPGVFYEDFRLSSYDPNLRRMAIRDLNNSLAIVRERHNK
jgi:hypothetical protein